MEFLPNIDLISVVVVIAATTILGFLAFFANPKSLTNRFFLLFSLITSLWSSFNYASYSFTEPDVVLWLIRLVIFAGIFHSMSFFLLALFFPQEEGILPKWVYLTILPAILVAPFTLTSLVYKSITQLTPVIQLSVGPLMPVFGIVVLTYFAAGIFILGYKSFHKGSSHKSQTSWVFWGMLLTFALTLLFNFFLPAFKDNPMFIPFGAVFMFPFILSMAYVTIKYRFFNLKTFSIGLLIFVLSIVSVIEVIFSNSLYIILFKTSEALLVIIFGIWLIRGVVTEIKQREEIEKLAKDLKVANDRLKELDRQKTEFVSIASHQLRSPLTAIKGYISLILEKNFGEYPETLFEPLNRIAESVRHMVNSVEDYLNVSRIEQGRIVYNKSKFNISELLKTVYEEYLPVAEKKGLRLILKASIEASVNADIGKIKQVIANLVDNSIKYTPEGSVSVSSEVTGKNAKVVIADTGIGLSAEDKKGLFDKFVRARGAHKVNTSGTGLGLYVAKRMVEAHGGKIWVESEGKGKGSQFIFEIPLAG